MNEIFNVEKIMSFCNYIFYTLVLNILFLFSNIPMVLFLTTVGIGEIDTYLFLFTLCFIPVAPSLCAVFYCMNKLIRDKDIRVFYDYKKGYTKNFKQSILFSIGEAVIFIILNINLKAFMTIIPSFFFTIVFSILLLMMFLVTPNIYMLTMRFKMSLLDILKAAITITIGKPLLTLGNLSAFLFTLMLYEIVPGTIVLFFISIYSFLVLWINQKLLISLEDK